MQKFWILVACLFVPALSQGETLSGGGFVPQGPGNCLPLFELDAIRAKVEARFGVAKTLPNQPRLLTTLYADPMGGGGIDSPDKTVQNYFDLDPGLGLLDWNCGVTTYDGHRGTDIDIGDFYVMDEGVAILAAAPGTVVYAHDGEFDRQTAWMAGVVANGVQVQHADGSYAIYWHMRNGSVRVSVGQIVATGDTLGLIGSSGFSSNPHLHFETGAPSSVETFTGACQGGASWWQSQPAYVWTLPGEIYQHGVTLFTVDRAMMLERPPSKTHVKRNNLFTSWIRGRNLRATDAIQWKVYQGAVLKQSVIGNPSADFTTSWWTRQFFIGNAVTDHGSWRVEIWLNGVLVATDPFVVDNLANKRPTIPSQTLSVPMDGSVTADFNGTDPDGSIFWYSVTGNPFHGTLALSGARRRHFTYTPAPGYVGPDSAYVLAQDDEGLVGLAPTLIRFDVTMPLAVALVAPRGLRIAAVAPNPVRGGTEIAYELARRAPVSIAIYDVSGARVRTLERGERDAGSWRTAWDARDDRGRTVEAGIYFVRLAAGADHDTRRISVTP